MPKIDGGKIKNFKELAINDARLAALQIAEAGLYAIDTGSAIRNFINVDENKIVFGAGLVIEPINKAKRIYFIGVGKCAYDAAVVVEEMLGDKLTGGIVLDVNIPELNVLKLIRSFAGTHPFPSDQNITVSKEIVSLLTELTVDDFIITVISGGGSTLLCLPNNDKTCIEERQIVETLFDVGATIQEINTVRKHLSIARGGYLAKHAYPAKVVSLIFSDVPGNDIGFIASGPTVKDETTVADAEKVLNKYKIVETENVKRMLIETPKEDKYFRNVYNAIVVSNLSALNAMENCARELSFEATIVTDTLTGEAKDTGHKIVNLLHSAHEKSVFLYGGETTVRGDGTGRGGRNQGLVLSVIEDLGPNELIVSFASDGRDNGDYMGAIADYELKKEAEKISLKPKEFLEKNNSTVFFEKLGGLLKSGHTGSNVSDLIIGIKF